MPILENHQSTVNTPSLPPGKTGGYQENSAEVVAPVDSPGKSPLVYIASASHSGSTLLAMLLGTQPGICTVGELRAPAIGDRDLYDCSCGERIKECSFWKSVNRAMAGKGIPDFDITNAGTSIYEIESEYARRLLEPLFRGRFLETIRDSALQLSPKWRIHLNDVQRRNVFLVEVLREISGAKFVVDSSKSILHLKYLLRNPKLDIRVIHMIRDGRAVALSLLGHGLKRPTRSETIAAAAREWRRSNESAECLIAALPASQCLQVRYEELCLEPEKILKTICKFIGTSDTNISLDFRSQPQHVIGNSMRLNTNAKIRLDERWKTQLSQEDLKDFDSVAGELNRNYGYGRTN